jgi:hypothetical protein
LEWRDAGNGMLMTAVDRFGVTVIETRLQLS